MDAALKRNGAFKKSNCIAVAVAAKQRFVATVRSLPSFGPRNFCFRFRAYWWEAPPIHWVK